eukprot:13325296-Alexandrium_andersonii.AAC.1
MTTPAPPASSTEPTAQRRRRWPQPLGSRRRQRSHAGQPRRAARGQRGWSRRPPGWQRSAGSAGTSPQPSGSTACG